MTVTLICAACGKRHEVDFPRPQLGIDLIPMAKSIKWHALHDSKMGRMVIFCSDKCIKANVNKDGTLRKYIRPPK